MIESMMSCVKGLISSVPHVAAHASIRLLSAGRGNMPRRWRVRESLDELQLRWVDNLHLPSIRCSHLWIVVG
jgi:hypothetical protein